MQAFLISPTKYYNDISRDVTSIRSILEKEPLTIGKLNRANDGMLKVVLVREIGNVLKFFGFDPSGADNNSVIMLVNNIVAKYYYFTLPDIYLCLAKATRGEYGQMYGRIDFSVVMQWFSKYDTERSTHVYVKPSEPYEPPKDAISQEEHIEQLRKRAEAGDEESKRMLDAALRVQERFKQMRRETQMYNEHKEHKFDKQRLNDEETWKRMKHSET